MKYTIEEVSKIVKKQKSCGKEVGLITGCFDVLHIGHVRLFKFAKKHVDYLVIGLDNDKTVLLTKGKGRPINSIQHRLETISELRNVDIAFKIKGVVDYKKACDAELIYSDVVRKICPDYLITSKKADHYWRIKKMRAKHLRVKFLAYTQNRITSSTEIINKLIK